MAKQPNNPFHPGEILIEEFLEPMGMTQAEFARPWRVITESGVWAD